MNVRQIAKWKQLALEVCITIKKTVQIIWLSSPIAVVAIALLTFASAIMPILLSWVGKPIVDTIVLAQKHTATDGLENLENRLLFWLGLEFALCCIQLVLDPILGMYRQEFGSRLTISVTSRILKKAMSVSLEQMEDPLVADKIARAKSEASSRPIILFQNILLLVRASVTLLGFAWVLVGYSWLVLCGLIVSGLPGFAAEAGFARRAYVIQRRRSFESRLMGYLENVMSGNLWAKELRLFDLEESVYGRHQSIVELRRKEDEQFTSNRVRWGMMFSLCSLAAFYACYAFVARSAITGAISLGSMALFLLALRQGRQAFQQILDSIVGIHESTLYMNNFFDLLELGEMDRSSRTDIRAKITKPMIEKGIRFVNVCYRYPGADRDALNDISMYIPTGSRFGIIGENGAGKTTFIKLLTRLYVPTSGYIYIDGLDIRDWDVTKLRARFGILFQDFMRYQFNAYENVVPCGEGGEMEAARVAKVLSKWAGDELLDSLPQRLNTQLGRLFEGGLDLSGGEWQKLGLSRAMAKRGADIMVLDEPTSSMDPFAEQRVMNELERLERQYTLVLISHRLAAVRGADEIIVLEDGRIVERGKHETLISVGERYRNMFQYQSNGYR